MSFPPYSAWPQAPTAHPWSAYGSAPQPPSLAPSLPHCNLLPAAKASQPNVLDASSLGLVGWPPQPQMPPQMPSALTSQPPPWPAMASGWYPRAPQAPPIHAAGSDASSRVLEVASSTTAPAIVSVESEKEAMPIGMNWGAKMVDSLLSNIETPESSKEGPAIAGDTENDGGSDLEKEGHDEADDTKFTEMRFRMLLIRQLLEEELAKPSVLKIRTVSANDVRLPPEHEVESIPEHRRYVPIDKNRRLSESSTRSHVAPASPEDPAEAGAFLLNLVKEREHETSGANDGAHLLMQLHGGGASSTQQQPPNPPQNPLEGKKVAESTSKGSSWTPTLRPAPPPSIPNPPSHTDGIAEGAALLGLLQGGMKTEQDGAAMGSALLRQLQGGKSETPATSSKSPAWQGGQSWESGAQWENRNERWKEPRNSKRGGKGRGKKGDEWW